MMYNVYRILYSEFIWLYNKKKCIEMNILDLDNKKIKYLNILLLCVLYIK